jgi:hypothetical protein
MEQKKVFWKQCGLFQLRVPGRGLPKSSKNAKASKRIDENRCRLISEIKSSLHLSPKSPIAKALEKLVNGKAIQ